MYRSCVLFTGSDVETATAAGLVMLNLDLPLSAILGESALVVKKNLQKRLHATPRCIVIDEKRPWVHDDFKALLEPGLLGVNGGLEVLVPSWVLNSMNILNLHPAYLPFNRGSHHSFWGIVDETPVGATIHWMVESLDAGPIIDQILIPSDPEITAEVLQLECNKLCVELLERNILAIFNGEPLALKPNVGGTSHSKSEIKAASTLQSNTNYPTNHIWNLIRATKHGSHGFYIENHGKTFHIKVSEISEVPDFKNM